MAHVQECKNGAKCVHYSAGKCKFSHPTMKRVVSGGSQKSAVGKLHKNPHLKLTNQAKLHMLRTLKSRKAALDGVLTAGNTALAVTPPKGWIFTGSDVKSPVPNADVVKLMQEAYDSDLKMIRNALASANGNKPVKFVVPYAWSGTIVTTITTGLLTATQNVLYADPPETTTLAALFDEYRMEAVRCEFMVPVTASTVVNGTSSYTSTSCFYMGYDPSDATAATASTDVSALEYHIMLVPQLQVVAAGTKVGGIFNMNSKPFTFQWTYRDSAAYSGTGGAVGPGQWKSTQGNTQNFPDGTIKTFWQSGETTAQNAVVGTQFRTMLFRNRT